ncbi:MAG: DegT/DnrJ/EryC1/StrS family aminotransferase [Saprospiraceae bacterium]|nr:DegT/DnrJ/EryC1/StrS family aminotransferase [Saprospiraceae bacterium]HMW40403.1 DegT/DnrJ/EryC1/StrS family aminotransferase [Saprospiraceae bacterium]HMX88275.1 DegT/DnrJ/EryC1/StrS family aminotransferase [Saprospiraceae bacterium]HMZ40441.1 DegT/DnrJ/EryC1/StrS family aminotransferase [Saprospiraceae bacterium]HNA64085.1 DegT/DnrJ/EryC1/StrS family aminotransferase [Saprospiraceae bacterium]
MNAKLQMVDLVGQYQKIKSEVDEAVLDVMAKASFIGGDRVKSFKANLEKYLGARHVIPCANGTDALQIAFMALGLQPGDEVIVPAFTYVATAEVIALLHLKPVLVDVNIDDFNIDIRKVKEAIGPRTKAIVPVHLFGQCAEMEAIMKIAREHNLYVVEDNAQAIGADYIYADGRRVKGGTISDIGCTSFFPSKNLGCYGDGGALFTQDDDLSKKITMIANHGQSVQYYHDVVGVNSRLDSIQAAILDIKLKHLDAYAAARIQAANYYDAAFAHHPHLITPCRNKHSTHVFHQYTLRVTNGQRDALKEFLTLHQIPCAIYYPLPLYQQKAFAPFCDAVNFLPVTDQLCKEVISLPMHTELTPGSQDIIIEKVLSFFK